MILIGVTGYRRSGKNSTTSILEHKYGFKQYAFADALRQMAEAINPVISWAEAPAAVLEALSGPYGVQKKEYRYLELLQALGYEKAKEIPDFRRFLQRLGTEGVRDTFGPNAWVDALYRKLVLDSPSKVAINDVRFSSEADFIRRKGGVLWRVIRPGVGGDDPHPSEVEIPSLPATREIVAASLDELERAVIAAYEADVG